LIDCVAPDHAGKSSIEVSRSRPAAASASLDVIATRLSRLLTVARQETVVTCTWHARKSLQNAIGVAGMAFAK
jgi:hypothetical protein